MGTAVAALSLPVANPAGRARGESQEHEERKGKAGWETKREKHAFTAGSNTPARYRKE